MKELNVVLMKSLILRNAYMCVYTNAAKPTATIRNCKNNNNWNTYLLRKLSGSAQLTRNTCIPMKIRKNIKQMPTGR